MFRLSESDYRKLEPIALKVYRGSARSAHVARLMESKIGRRALVDMMFLEDRATEIDKIVTTLKNLNDIQFGAVKSGIEASLRILGKSLETGEEGEQLTKTKKESFFTKVKNFFAKIYNWLTKMFKTGWEKIKSFFTWLYSLFFKEANLKSPRWLNIAIAVTVAIALGYFLFGTEAGKKVRSFILNAIKGGLGAVKSAVRYVLGKSGAPKEVVDETEDFLNEATA